MTIEFRPAKREAINLIIGLISGTGGGKTRTALRLATGMSDGKRFVVLDTENRRALHYSDDFSFDHYDFKPPFRPERFTEAIKAADAAGYPVIVIDSASMIWAGEGGVLDWQEDELDRMAGDDWKKREAVKMASWIKPKMAHKAFVQSLLQIKAHIILCLRSEQKIEMVRENGKMVVHAKQSLTSIDGHIPICDKNLPFELTASLLFTADSPGMPKPIKLQSQHRELFPLDRQVDEASGKKIAEWAKGGTKAASQTSQATQASSEPADGVEYISVDAQTLFEDMLRGRYDLKESLLKKAGCVSLAMMPADKYSAALAWLKIKTDAESGSVKEK